MCLSILDDDMTKAGDKNAAMGMLIFGFILAGVFAAQLTSGNTVSIALFLLGVIFILIGGYTLGKAMGIIGKTT